MIKASPIISAILVLIAQVITSSISMAPAQGFGLVRPPLRGARTGRSSVKGHSPTTRLTISARKSGSARAAKRQAGALRRGKRARAAKKPVAPQSLIGQWSQLTLAPGVVYKTHRGALRVNLLDIDLETAPVDVRPVMAGQCFDRLCEVKTQARQTQAIAAVNANYFKKNGTPLGTLIIDGEWVSGPLYDRVSMGFTSDGRVKIDQVSLYGVLESSNPEADRIWVNNINQPRRTGSRLIAYTRRWGSRVVLPYAGCLIAVDNRGQVVKKTTTIMEIPWGGYVLADSRTSKISNLQLGDQVQITWKTRPENWSDVVHAVSGGPTLIRDGKLYVNLRGENFRLGWTSSKIVARTAAGVTRDNHLLLATVEGPHTMWDLAKFLHKMGAVDAMNLDGGGSTTMVVNGATVTRNANAKQRRVASSLAILPRNPELSGQSSSPYRTNFKVTDFGQQSGPDSPDAVSPDSAGAGEPALKSSGASNSAATDSYWFSGQPPGSQSAPSAEAGNPEEARPAAGFTRLFAKALKKLTRARQ